jgi:hypothetical protein
MSEKLSLVKLAEAINSSKLARQKAFKITARSLQRWRKRKIVPFPDGEFALEDATAALTIIVAELVSSGSDEVAEEGSLLEAKLKKINEEIRMLQLKNDDFEVSTGRREVLVSPLEMQKAMAILSGRLVATYHQQIWAVVYTSLRDCGIYLDQGQCDRLQEMVVERAAEQWVKAVQVLHQQHPLTKAFADGIQNDGQMIAPISPETVSVREWESPLTAEV